MKKMPCLFNIKNNKHDIESIKEDCEWVLTGEGVAHKKYDGTSCLIENGELFKRYEVKKGKTPPNDFSPADKLDENTGKQVGWIPVGTGNEDKYHREGFENLENKKDGTYELIGPKVQGNPENVQHHILIRHDTTETYLDFPRDVSKMEKFIDDLGIEGVVIYRDNGEMVKIRSKDFK